MIESILTATDEMIVRFVHDYQAEFGTEVTSVDRILNAIAEGRMCIERRDFGFAILEVENRPRWFLSPGANLCYLYVLPKYRGEGVGRKFVRELVSLHSKDYLMSLYASEAWRVKFYQSCRFQIVEDMGDGSFRMETTGDDE